MRGWKKIVWLILFCMLFSGCASQTIQERTAATPLGELQTVFLKIGKADAAVLVTAHHTVLVDTGEEEDGEEILSYLKKRNINRLDALILTHFDKDHVGGAEKVMRGISVDTVYQPDYIKDSGAYRNYQTACEALSLTPRAVTQRETLTMDQVQIEILPPEHKYSGQDADSNAMSLVVDVTHGSNRLLLAGDASGKRISELLAEDSLACTLLKVPHHGREEEQTREFLAAAAPTCAVITCSQKNPPDEAVTQQLKEQGCAAYLTMDGDIACISDGSGLRMIQKDKGTYFKSGN